MAFRTCSLLALLLSLALGVGLSGCPADDDDTAGDDDSAGTGDDDVGDDDAGDDDAGDDDGGDDDTEVVNYLDAVVPDFADCAGNQFKLVLGDGTALGPFEGHVAEASFANNSMQFTIRTGTDTVFTALNGNYSGMSPGERPIQGPSSQPGNVVVQAMLDASAIGTAPVDLAGAYGLPTTNMHPSVGGTVTFDAVPAPDAATSGTYQGILQKMVSLSTQQVLLGVRGCFDATLHPTD